MDSRAWQLPTTVTRTSDLITSIEKRVEAHADREAFIFLADGESETARLTYAEMWHKSLQVANFLRRQGARHELVLLLLPSGLDFIVSLFGCLLAGAVAIPAPPPHRERGLARVRSIIADSRARLVISNEPIPKDKNGAIDPAVAHLAWYSLEEILAATDVTVEAFERPDPHAAAIIQYTSGSTGDPKGIVISHANAFANIYAQRAQTGSLDCLRQVSWLPVHHDLGLFANVIALPLLGGTLVLMPPTVFIQKPLRWMLAIDKYRATVSGAPNFGFDLCVRTADPTALQGIDLSCWTTAYNGAEPIRAETLRSFTKAYAPYGFRAEAWCGCYGLAEATLMVTGASKRMRPILRTYTRASLAEGIALPAGEDETGLRQTLVGSGSVVPGHKLRIVSTATGKALGERCIGEICFAGPSVSAGFLRQPDATARKFGLQLEGEGDDRFLRTGDLGFIDQSELFVVSRVDDLIVWRGRNIAPQDIEDVAQRSYANRIAGAAAFLEDDETLVLVMEVARDVRSAEDLDAVAAAARRAVWLAIEANINRVVLVRPGSIPRTTSGKVRRRATRAALASGEIRIARDLTGTAVVSATPSPSYEMEPATTPLTWLQHRLKLPAPPDTNLALLQLGLDSLGAGEFATWLAERYGRTIPYSDLLSERPLSDLLAPFQNAVPLPPGIVPSAIVTNGIDGGTRQSHPLTRMQLALWAELSVRPDTGSYNTPLALRLPAEVDDTRIRQALETLSARHAGLRSIFEHQADGPIRWTDQRTELPFSAADLSHLAPDMREARMVEASRAAFVLDGPPLWRAIRYQWDQTTRFLVLTLHHLICDGLSTDWLGRELSALLNAAPEIEPAAPDTLDDVVAEEEAYLSTPQYSDDIAYWRGELLPSPPPLVTRHTVPGNDARHQASHAARIILEGTTLKRARAAAAASGISFTGFLLAIYTLAVHRVMAQDDIFVAIAASVRDSGQANLLAPLINPVLLRSQLPEEDCSLREFAKAVTHRLYAALEHRRLPFSLLVDKLDPALISRDGGIYQAAFGHVRLTRLAPSLEACASLPASTEALPLLLHTQEGTNPLLMAWFETEDSCIGLLSGQPNWFSLDAVETMGKLIVELIDQAGSETTQKIGELTYAADCESKTRHLQSVGPRARSAVEFDGWAIPALVFRSAEIFATRTAVIGGDQPGWSYQRLNQAVRKVRSQIIACGVGPGHRVVLNLERSPAWLVGALAVMASGAAFVPLDPTQSAERNAFIVDDCDAALVLTRSNQEGSSLPYGKPWLALDDAMNNAAIAADENAIADQSAAYVLYTSGSTGQPKGVEISHAALRERLLWKVETFAMTEQDRVLQSIPLLFDPSIWEVFTPLLCGAAVVLAPPKADRDAALLASLVGKHGVTMMSCVSSVLPYLGDAFAGGPATMLRRIITGGEALPIVNRRAFQKVVPITVDHFYGPTEAAIFATHHEILYDADELERAMPAASVEPAGRPAAGAEIHIVSPRGSLLPPGSIGEIVIAGRGLANTYVNRDEETRKRFVTLGLPSPRRCYRTGDLGRWSSEGELEVVGRIDEQIKLRGVRIEPAEVEAALMEAGGIIEAMVTLEKRPEGDSLAAWIATSIELTKQALQEHLADRLPPAFIPNHFYQLPALPRLPSGKVDKHALPSASASPVSEAHLPAEDEASTARSNHMEAILLRLWREVLEQPDLTTTDDLFFQGAHSLMIMRVANRLSQNEGILLPVNKMFELRTIRRQAAFLDNLEEAEQPHGPKLIRLTPAHADRNLVCIMAGCGDLGRLERLAGELQGDMAVWALLPPDAPPPSGKWDLEPLLDAYNNLVEARLGDLPMMLAGFSVGGPVAVSLARRMDKPDVTGRHIILFDCAYPCLAKFNVALYMLMQAVLRRLATIPFLRRTQLLQRVRRISEDVGLETQILLLPQWHEVFQLGRISIIRGSLTRWLTPFLFSPWKRQAREICYRNSRGVHGGLFDHKHTKSLAAIVRELIAASGDKC